MKEGNVLFNDALNTFYLRMASDIWLRTILIVRKERKGNVLFNDALNTFYLRMASDILLRTILIVRKERKGNVLFNDALNTFYLRLYGVGHIVKDHSDSEKGKERKCFI